MKRYLFLDPLEWEQVSNAEFRVNPPRCEPVVWGERMPWERMLGLYLTVIDDGGRLRLWHGCRKDRSRQHVGYAESLDGIHWTRPHLEICDLDGSRANNLTNLPTMAGSVFTVPHAPPAERYQYVGCLSHQGIYRWTSADGLSWTRDEDALLQFESDTQNNVFWDERLQRFVGYARMWKNGSKAERRRKVGRWEAMALDRPLPIVPSSGIPQAGQEKLPHITNEMPVVLQCDAQDPDMTDVYLMAAAPYPLDTRYYLGFPAFYRHFPEPEEGPYQNHGRTEVQCVGSSDSIRWHRYDRTPYARPGLAGSSSGNMIYMGVGMIVRGDEIWQYGIGFDTRHGEVERRIHEGDGTVLRFVQRVDGFVSLDMPASGGCCYSRPLSCEGARLVLNMDTGALGGVRVELLDEEGAVIPGYALEDSDSMQGNNTSAIVSWRGKHSLIQLVDKNIRLRLAGERCKIFSVRFED